MKMTVVLGNIPQAAALVRKCGMYGDNISMTRGNYRVDAKSLLGVLSLSMGQPVTIECSTENEALKQDIAALLG